VLAEMLLVNCRCVPEGSRFVLGGCSFQVEVCSRNGRTEMPAGTQPRPTNPQVLSHWKLGPPNHGMIWTETSSKAGVLCVCSDRKGKEENDRSVCTFDWSWAKRSGKERS
jgi:hypothetical protein